MHRPENTLSALMFYRTITLLELNMYFIELLTRKHGTVKQVRLLRCKVCVSVIVCGLAGKAQFSAERPE